MNLTDAEKYKIYLEEKERLKSQEEHKLKNIPIEEKEKIFKEFQDNKIVYVDMENVIFPRFSLKHVSWIWGIGIVIVYYFISILGTFLWLIGFPILVIILGVRNVTLFSTAIRYSCPDCNHVHQNNIRVEEKKEMEITGYIKAKCFKCSCNFNLIVEKKVFSEVTPI